VDKTYIPTDEAWQPYGRALIAAMQEVLEEVDDEHREVLLEVADFWLGLGLVIGLDRREGAERLLSLLIGPAERAELISDAEDLLRDALP
jgi:hypothetical protein